MIQLKKHHSVFVLSLLLCSCATAPQQQVTYNDNNVYNPGASVQQSSQKNVEVVSSTQQAMSALEISEILDEERIRNEASEQKQVVDKNAIPLPTNKYVNKWIDYFTGSGRYGMQKFLERSGKYVESMKKVLTNKGLPEDLVYLPVIESGFATKALSNKGAMGYWQFMPSTARQYGLKVNSMVDERRDYIRSTEAAAVYLKKLYTVFGDWYLALAAYNAGENRVKSQLMRAETRNYWELIDKKSLYKETRDYVPKYIAATLIAKSPESFGFKQIKYMPEQNYQKLYVKKPIDLKKLARTMGTSYSKLKKLNPRYKTTRVPIYRGKSVLVRVPRGQLARAQASLLKSQTYIAKNTYKPLTVVTYKVRKGDNLTKIARRFGVTVRSLKKANGLGRRSTLYVGRKLKVHSAKKGRANVARTSQKAKSKYRNLKKTHKVRRGESLSVIAARHGLTVSQLAKRNGLSTRAKLRVGQKLKLNTSSSRSVASGVINHKVRYGENLNLIARKYGTTVKKIKSMNSLRTSRLNVGQKLKVQKGQLRYHVVKKGESLIAIAKKYQVSLGNLLSVNKFKNKSRINIGSTIKIPLAMN